MADRKISDLTALTTPASGDFLPIVDISEAAAASKNKRITIEELMRGMPDGTAAAPGIAFESDPNTGIYSPGADQVAISTNGTGRLFVDANGNVGVSDSSPSTNTVGAGAPTVVLRGSSGAQPTRSAGLCFISQDGTSKTLQYHDNGILYTQSTTATAQAWFTNNLERLRLTSAGLLGLGTSAPLTLLELAGNGTAIVRATNSNPGIGQDALIGAYEFYKADASGNGAGVAGAVRVRSADSVGASAYMTLSTSASSGGNDIERVRVTSAGLVGIGTTAPAGKLHVNVASDTAAIFYSSGANIVNIAALNDAGNSSKQLVLDGSPLAFSIASVEKARLDSSGRLLIGTSTSPSTGDGIYARIVVQGYTGSATGGAYISLQRGEAATAITAGEEIANIVFGDNAGNSFGIISCFADANAGSGDYPGRLVFSTTSDGAATVTERLRITSAGVLQVADAGNIAVGTTTGTKIGTATTQKIGFYNATPVVQPAAVADATTAVDVITQLNDLLAKLRTLGIIAT